jgi:hypothetical protein
VNNLPKPVLDPVMRTTSFEIMIVSPYGCYRELSLMPDKAGGYDTRVLIMKGFVMVRPVGASPERAQAARLLSLLPS